MDSADSAPGPPRHVAVLPVDGAAVVSWERPVEGPHVTRYEVVPLYGCTPLPERAVTVDGASASALVRGLLNGATYTARVTAWHDGQEGPPATSPIFEPNPAPGAPQGVVATGGEQSVTVRWTPPVAGGPVAHYRVAGIPHKVAPVQVPAMQTTALVAGLPNHVRFTFTVTAVNAAGENVSSPSNPVWPGDDVPRYLFPLVVTYLVVLGLLAYLYAVRYQPIPIGGVVIPVLRDAVPPTVAGVPISIPWFGALGATLISLYGIFDHGQRDWERSLNKWHVSRPLTGAVLGTMGFILFAAVIRAAGLAPGTPDVVGKLVYFAVAFVVGFREETFRLLIKRVADLIIGPGTAWIARPTTITIPVPTLPMAPPSPPAPPAPMRASVAPEQEHNGSGPH
jgi:hypothetical protein